MSISSAYISPAGTASNVVFTALCLAISNQLDTFIPVTTDTGQTTFGSTQAVPGGANTYPYYQIRKFTDATQSTFPIFLKVEYGYGSQTQWGLRITVGVATNGAGSLTGTTSTAVGIGTFATNAALLPCYFSGDGSRFQMLLFNNDTGASNNTCGFSISRLRDNTGAYITSQSSVNICALSVDGGVAGARTKLQQTLISGSANPTSPIQVQCSLPIWGTDCLGLNFGVHPVFPMLGFPGPADFSILMFLTSASPTIGQKLATFSIYGTPHTFITRAQDASNTGVNGNAGAYSFFMLYE